MSVSLAPEQHAVLHGISWQTYERLLGELEDRHLRLTYDSGTLEVMSPSRPHERIRHLLGRMIEAATEELGVAIEGSGSTTWRRQDLEQGLEADECYWVQNEAKIRGRDELDLRVDPPPDLAIEVDVSSSSLDRLRIYGALGVPEVWRWRDGHVVVHLRRSDGTYAVSEQSACFPWMPMDELSAWLDRAAQLDENSRIRAFRAWVRGTLRTS